MAKISSDMCNKIRKRANSSEKIIDIAEDMNLPDNTISYHASGKCEHLVSTDAPPTSRDVSEDECKKIRQCYKNKNRVRKVAEEFNRAKKTIIQHINANCKHNVTEDIANPSGARVFEKECITLRRRAKNGSSVNELAEDACLGTQTVTRHVTGECWHNVEAPALDIREFTDKVITEEICNNARKIFRNSSNKKKDRLGLMHKYNCNNHVLYNHLEGYCECEVDEEPVDFSFFDRISPAKCQKIRRMYDSDTSYVFIADYLNIADSTVGYHVKAKCEHDVEENLAKKYK
jgi:5-methylcytosine-specific restriction protein A